MKALLVSDLKRGTSGCVRLATVEVDSFITSVTTPLPGPAFTILDNA